MGAHGRWRAERNFDAAMPCPPSERHSCAHRDNYYTRDPAE